MCYFWLFQNHKYGERILVQIGIQIIDPLVATMTKKNCSKVGKPGNRYPSTALSLKDCLNVIVEPVTEYLEHFSMARSYGVLKPGKDKIDVCLRNHSAKQITLAKETAVGKITAANIIPALLVQKPTGHGAGE